MKSCSPCCVYIALPLSWQLTYMLQESKFLKSGKMSFDATQGVVTLDNVVYENPATGIDGDFFSLDYPGVTGHPAKIILKGENKVTCGDSTPST